MTETTHDTRVAVEHGIQIIIRDMQLTTKTTRSANRARRTAITVLANALSQVIADTIVRDETVLPSTLAQYTLVRDWQIGINT